MIEAPPRKLLVDLGADLHLPPGWRDQAARATAAVERSTLLAQLRRQLLVATRYGRDRLRAWLDGARHERMAADEIREHLSCYGETDVVALVIEALALVPPAVCSAALREVAFLSVGRRTRAWTSAADFVGRIDGQRKAHVVVLGPEANVHTVLRELGHVWHASPADPRFPPLATQGKELLLEVAAADGCREVFDAANAREETRAEACALSWAVSERRPW